MDHRRPVQAEGTGNIPLKAGHAYAHVPWITQFLQQRRQDADTGTDPDDPPFSGKNIFPFHQFFRLLSLRKNRYANQDDAFF